MLLGNTSKVRVLISTPYNSNNMNKKYMTRGGTELGIKRYHNELYDTEMKFRKLYTCIRPVCLSFIEIYSFLCNFKGFCYIPASGFFMRYYMNKGRGKGRWERRRRRWRRKRRRGFVSEDQRTFRIRKRILNYFSLLH